MHIVLMQPEIPQNTGNIARTCAATGAQLHLIEPLGFELSDRYLKRAGLDYWHMMHLTVHKDLDAFIEAYPDVRLHYLSTKAPRDYCQVRYQETDTLVFGRETKGLPESLLKDHYDSCLRIPMQPDARSLNLSNSVAVVLYEALRQQGFPGLKGEGALSEQVQGADWVDYV
ncbi:tRNA (uridine(34)/cytosine(34)/5-carboxymethylaminomethyluridine(34)-2'-O)-methyltransferase TrmL [Eubacteriales bacterium OttesenSCG-928-N13]|nr:tRNA (uridine(34)/cytosine(34)/5-carboxymethylaminomethyluridine(34)-2'-O)-methyltransferase TrmL [Eubacteriales bacterium OttesenSCG-928-N13]